MKSNLDLFPTDTTPHSFLYFIKPLTNFNVVLGETVESSHFFKYELLTKLHLTYYTLKEIGLPSDEDWSTLQKLAQISHES